MDRRLAIGFITLVVVSFVIPSEPANYPLFKSINQRQIMSAKWIISKLIVYDIMVKNLNVKMSFQIVPRFLKGSLHEIHVAPTTRKHVDREL